MPPPVSLSHIFFYKHLAVHSILLLAQCNWWRENRQLSYASRATVGHSKRGSWTGSSPPCVTLGVATQDRHAEWASLSCLHIWHYRMGGRRANWNICCSQYLHSRTQKASITSFSLAWSKLCCTQELHFIFHLQNYDKQLMNALSDVSVYACVLVSASVSHSRTFRRTVGGRRLWCARSSTSFTPSWRRRRGRWVRRWRSNRKRRWTISGVWQGSTETTWRRAVRLWRRGSRLWRSRKWLYFYRSESIPNGVQTFKLVASILCMSWIFVLSLLQNTKPLLKMWVHVSDSLLEYYINNYNGVCLFFSFFCSLLLIAVFGVIFLQRIYQIYICTST